MQSKHICVLSHSYPRFVGDWHANFIDALAQAYAKYTQVTVLVPYVHGAKRQSFTSPNLRIKEFRYLPVDKWHTIGNESLMKKDKLVNLSYGFKILCMCVCSLFALMGLLLKQKIDMVQAHWAVPNGVIALLAVLLTRAKTKVFISFPGSDVTVMSLLGPLGRMTARFLKRADLLSCNSSDLRDDLCHMGIAEDDIKLIIYGVDPKQRVFNPQARRSVRERFAIKDDDVVLLMVGRFVPKKGFSFGFRALRRIVQQHPNTRVLVLGSGPLADEYKQILERDRTTNAVTFVGEVPSTQIADYYSACDILLMPSQRDPSDGLNVVVVEAMSCARPIVASNVGGNDLVVYHGTNGFLHAATDYEALAEAALRLLADRGLREAMGAQSLRLVNEKFNWLALAKEYLSYI